MYNVLEVNKTSYENCIETDFITNITKGGRDVFQLTEPRFYYFLSGRGFCWQGMKVALQVLNNSSQPSSSPLPHKNSSSGLGFTNGIIQVLVLLLSALVQSFFYLQEWQVSQTRTNPFCIVILSLSSQVELILLVSIWDRFDVMFQFVLITIFSTAFDVIHIFSC